MSLLFYNTCFYSIHLFAQAPTSDDEDSELDKPIKLFTQDEKKKGGHKKSKVAEYLMDEDSVASMTKGASLPKLEIFPDPKRGPTDEHDPPASKKKKGFKEDIVAICNHCKYAGERTYDLLMEMKSGWRGWGTSKEIHNDVVVYEQIHSWNLWSELRTTQTSRDNFRCMPSVRGFQNSSSCMGMPSSPKHCNLGNGIRATGNMAE
jgi:hypothetical protein